MRLSGTRTGELLDAVAARCDRLVASAVGQPAERLRQRRLLGVLLAAPLLVAAAAAVLFPPLIGTTATLAAGAAMAGVAALAATVTMATGKARFAEACGLLSGTLALASIVAAAGGPASPATLVLTALIFETWWVKRTARAALAGTGAALFALALQAVISVEFLPGGAGPVAAHWLIPLAYLALVLPRLAAAMDERADVTETAARPLEEVVEGVVITTDLAGEVTDASGQARRILGLPPELLLSTGLFDRLHVADRVAYLCALSDLRAKEGFRRVEVRLRVPGSSGHAAGDYRSFNIEMMRPAGDKGLTLLVRAAEETATLRSALAASAETAESRDIARSRMLGAVGHELRTPLNSIIGFSDMLLTGMLGNFSDPRQKEYVRLVHESGCHLLSVVNSMLDVSRIESGAYAADPEPFHFCDAVRMCRTMLEQQAKERELVLQVEVPPEIGEIHADKRAVKQILINLVSNAIKFTPAGGTVAIGAKRIGSRLHFWVSDTGIGMSADDLAVIGQPFTQVLNDYTKKFDGAGLGLSLVKGLVALHRGTVAIESEPGHGTTVTISLPVDAPARATATKATEIVAMKASRPREDLDGTFRKTA